MSEKSLLGLSTQRKLYYCLPVLGPMLVAIFYMLNSGCLRRHGVRIGGIQANLTDNMMSLSLTVGAVPYIVINNMSLSVKRGFVEDLLAFCVAVILIYHGGWYYLELQKKWGIEDEDNKDISIPGLLDGSLERAFYGTRPVVDKASRSKRVYELSKQKLVLLVPYVNCFFIAGMALRNIRNLNRQAKENGSVPTKGNANIMTRTVITIVVLTGFTLILETAGLLSFPWLMMIGAHFCTLVMGLSCIRYQKKLGIEE